MDARVKICDMLRLEVAKLPQLKQLNDCDDARLAAREIPAGFEPEVK